MPKAKKAESSSNSDSDSGPEDRNPPKSKQPKLVEKNKNKNEDDSNSWTLEKLRMVKVREFRGRKMVDIREHYEKDGEILPGKKGISLSSTQWKKLVEIVDEVSAALNE